MKPVIFAFSLPLFAITSLQITSARADEAMMIAGGQVGGQNSTYGLGGFMVPLPGSHFGDGWIIRAFAEELTYRYRTGSRNIDARALGGNASVGYQISGPQGWLGVYGGPAYRHTHLSPDDPGSDARGGNVTARLQLEGEYNVTQNAKLNANSSYEAFNNNAHWTRVRALHRISGSMFAGPEGVFQGDDDYQAWQAGVALVGVELTDKSSLGVDAGVRKTEKFDATPYVGLDFGHRF